MHSTCICCDQQLAHEDDYHDLIYDGMLMDVRPGYGSVHDTGPRGFDGRLSRADVVHAYLCDDCFTKKQHLLRGYTTHNRRTVYTETVSPTPLG